MDTLKIKRDNKGKRRKRKNKRINKRIKTLIIKAYKIGKFDNINITLIIYKYNRYIIYKSKAYILWPLSIVKIVNKATICLSI